jgi:hypothetical protein
MPPDPLLCDDGGGIVLGKPRRDNLEMMDFWDAMMEFIKASHPPSTSHDGFWVTAGLP